MSPCSFISLVKHSLVPVGSSRQTDILCVHGDKHPYPIADITVTIDEQPYLLTVGVVEHLPVDAILGWDLPVLMDLLQETELPVEIDSGEEGEEGEVDVIFALVSMFIGPPCIQTPRDTAPHAPHVRKPVLPASRIEPSCNLFRLLPLHSAELPWTLCALW